MMEFFGLRPEDYPEKYKSSVDVWPENWLAVVFFEALGIGSWNMGPGGPVGLRYETFKEVRMAQGIADNEWPELFKSVRILESAALSEMHRDPE